MRSREANLMEGVRGGGVKLSHIVEQRLLKLGVGAVPQSGRRAKGTDLKLLPQTHKN